MGYNINMMNSTRLVNIDQRALIINKDGQVLLVKENGLDWDLPGGLMDEGKSWRDALEDLIAEKLNMQIAANQPVYAADYINPENGDYTYTAVVQCDCYENVIEPQEEVEAEWFDVEEIPTINFAVYEMKDAIVDYFSKLDSATSLS